ncbi:STAS domain-containing protein [Amycolatopsis sp. NPDC004378]
MPHDDIPAAAASPAELITCLFNDHERPAWLTVRGEIDVSTVGELDAALRRSSAAAAGLVIDLRAATVCSAVGIRVLCRYRDAITAVLVAPRGSVHRVLTLPVIAEIHELPIMTDSGSGPYP